MTIETLIDERRWSVEAWVRCNRLIQPETVDAVEVTFYYNDGMKVTYKTATLPDLTDFQVTDAQSAHAPKPVPEASSEKSANEKGTSQ